MHGVSSSRVLKFALLLLVLAVSLGWKLGVRPSDSSDVRDKAFQMQVASFLGRQRLVVSVSDRFEEGQPFIRATGGLCRLIVIQSPAIGSDRDVTRQQASRDDEVFVVYRGIVSQEQPTIRTVLDFLWTRLRRELGINTQSVPVLTIIATKSCQAAEMPWKDLM